MKVSVIIPTYNGAGRILNLIRSLERQTVLPHEVIIVIDGSTDSTADLLKGTQVNLDKLRVVVQENMGRANVRNRGAGFATGEILIFFDDDMILDTKCVEEHCKHQLAFPNSIFTGRLDSPKNNSDDFTCYLEYLNKKWGAKSLDFLVEELSIDNLFCSANNLSISRTAFNDIGGFYPNLRDGEDYILAFHGLKKGYKVFNGNSAAAIHDSRFTFSLFVKRQREYFSNRLEIKKLLPEIYEHLISKNDYKAPNGLKGSIYKFFSNSWFLKSVENGSFLFFPKAIRYRLYDVIVIANSIYFPEKVVIA